MDKEIVEFRESGFRFEIYIFNYWDYFDYPNGKPKKSQNNELVYRVREKVVG